MKTSSKPSRRPWALALALFAAVAAISGCASDSSGSSDPSSTEALAKDALVNLVTLQTGTITEIDQRRGTGPFKTYPLSVPKMMEVVTAVLKTQVPAVFPCPNARKVIAKERKGKDALSDEYDPPFASAVGVYLEPIEPGQTSCRVEIHAIRRGPFHQGHIDWERILPPLLDQAVAHPEKTPIVPLR